MSHSNDLTEIVAKTIFEAEKRHFQSTLEWDDPRNISETQKDSYRDTASSVVDEIYKFMEDNVLPPPSHVADEEVHTMIDNHVKIITGNVTEDIDPTTGLPGLPPNMRWRVIENKSKYSEFPLRIKLQVRRSVFWRTVASSLSKAEFADLSVSGIYALRDWKRSQTPKPNLVPFIGTYPPQRLWAFEDK